MAKAQGKHGAIVGVAEHGNSAELVTVDANGNLLDRRRIDLTRGLPTHPYHHEGSWAIGRYADSPWARKISLPEAITIVERVHAAAARGARESLKKLADAIPVAIASIALRACPELPATIEERIRDTRASNVADSVMYREALAEAAKERGWTVCWYDRELVFTQAADVLGTKSSEPHLRAMGKAAGPPWQARHKLAAAAAIAAGSPRKARGRG